MSPLAVIPVIVGVITCIIGISTFVSAQITKAKQDGMLSAKIEQCVKNTEEIKNDIKDKNKEYDSVLDEHGKAIIQLQTEMKMVQKELNIKLEGDLK